MFRIVWPNTNLLLMLAFSLNANCPQQPPTKATRVKQESRAARVSDIDLAAIGSIAPKGRVQDRDYNDLPVVTKLIQHGKKAIPYLISKLDDETRIKSHVMDYWSDVRVADVALIILTDFFTDSTWQKSTIPGVSWDEFLERANHDLTAEQVLRYYISKHGRKAIKARWQALWLKYRNQLVWDTNQRCFRLTSNEAL